MTYSDKFDREIVLDTLDEASKLALKIVMKEGELRFRDALIAVLEKDIADYLYEIDSEPNTEWIDGVRYVIHMLKEVDLGE